MGIWVLGICCEAVNGGGGLGRAGHPWPAAVLVLFLVLGLLFLVVLFFLGLRASDQLVNLSHAGIVSPGELRCRFGSAEQSGPAWFYHAF